MLRVLFLCFLVFFTSSCEQLFMQERETLVRTTTLRDVSVQTASISGVLLDITAVDNNPVTNFGHCWATQENPSIADFSNDLGVPETPQSFTSNLVGLTEGTTYYVRAYAQTDTGVEYGNVIRFTPGLARTNAVYNISTANAIAEGTLNSNTAEIVIFGHCWAVGTLPTIDDARSEFNTPDEFLPDLRYSSELTALQADTTYYLRSYVITPDNIPVYGELFIFETPEE